MPRTVALVCLAGAFQGLGTAAVELRIRYRALEKFVAEQMFTQDGRRYLKGSKDTRCNYAYLEHPVIGGENGFLRIEARFSGRSSLDFFGKCVGLGDAFTVTILGVLQYRNGYIELRDVVADSNGQDSFYIRRVRTALTRSIPEQFRFPAAEEARRILEQGGDAAYPRKLRRFAITSIRLDRDAIVLAVDLELSIE